MIRSEPTSRGLSMSTGTPVRTPGSTTTLGTSAKCAASMSRHSCSTAGTVAHTAMPVTPLDAGPEQPAEQHRPLVGGAPLVGGDPPVGDDLAVGEQPEHGVAVADVGREQRHGQRLLEVHAEVEDPHRVGERADRDEVDPGLGDLARPLEGEPAGGLERGAPGGDPHRLGHRRAVHVVEQDRSQPASSSSRSWSRSVTSTSTRSSGYAARTARYAGTTPPAATTWLSLTIAMSERLNRWLTPPPQRTAYFCRAR